MLKNKTDLWNRIYVCLSGVILFLAAFFLYSVNHYVSGLVLVLGSVILYFASVLLVYEKNWLHLGAVFSTIWLFTTGLSAFRLLQYQKEWETKTWLLFLFIYIFFFVGCELGTFLGNRFSLWCTKQKGKFVKGISLSLHENRLFWICFFVTLMGIVCFIGTICTVGFVPYFSSSTSAYADFKSRFHIFSVSATMISGLSYYTLCTQKLSLWKKIFLVFSVIYSTFLFPMLIVSRGGFLMSAIVLTAAVFYIHKKRFWILLLCVAVIAVFFKEGTTARGYSQTELNSMFEPSHIVWEEDSETEETGSDEQQGFQLSGTASFIYSYITVSHDNFNEAVLHTENYTYGARQMIPFNIILKIPVLDEIVENGEYHLVRPHLNTVNLFGLAYYDFGAIGTVLIAFIWAMFFGMTQGYHNHRNTIFSILAVGGALIPCTLCFFAAWLSNFAVWTQWGLMFLMFLAACVTPRKKNDSIKENQA